MIEIILITLALIVLIIASVIDIKSHEIPDYLTYGLIAIGLAIKLIYSILTGNYYFILYALVGLASMYLIGSLLYYTKQWGGGDAKLLMGLGVAFASPEFVSSRIPFLLTLFTNIMIIGLIYSTIISLVLILIHWKKFIFEFKILSKIKFYKNLEKILFFVSLTPLIAIFFTEPRFLFLIFFLLINIYAFLHISVKALEKAVMYKNRLTKNLVEGDWLIAPIEKDNKILVKPRNIGLTKEDIQILIKNKIKSVLIKEGVPFAPAIALAVIFSLIYPRILLFLFFI